MLPCRESYNKFNLKITLVNHLLKRIIVSKNYLSGSNIFEGRKFLITSLFMNFALYTLLRLTLRLTTSGGLIQTAGLEYKWETNYIV